MSWADHAIAALARGESITIHPRGHSMRPRIVSGQAVTLEPGTPTVGDVALAKVSGRVYLHTIKAEQAGRYLIARHDGRINGWTRTIYGVAVDV